VTHGRNRMLAFAAGLALVILATAPVLAATETFSIDPGHSQVGFKIRHFVSKVPGRFDAFTGTITVDRSDLKSAKISVDIDVASIDTANAKRDGDLKTPNFFDAEKFPKMTFESTEIVPKGADKATLKGNLTLRGVTKPVELDVDILGFSPDPWGGLRGGFEARGTINRKDFGMTWNKTLDTGGVMLGEDVELMLNVEAVRQEPKPAAK
jgi:polyisoprenoid-binding protein YceI